MAMRSSRVVAVTANDRQDRHPLALTGDLRFDIFAAVFALSTINHTLQMLLEQQVVGPVDEYLERWRNVVPTVDWPSALGLAITGAMLLLSLLTIALPSRRLMLALLALPTLAWNLVSPERIPAHNSVMAAALAIVLLLALGEIVERRHLRSSPALWGGEWYAWTLIGLRAVCVLTYAFSFVQKMNPEWFAGQAPITTSFLYQPIEPLVERLGLRPQPIRQLLMPLAVFGTLVLELTLPLLLYWRRTRLWGCLLGLLFHLPMLARAVGDFPVMIVAFYPLFLSRGEAGELLRRCVRPLTLVQLTFRAGLGALGAFTILRSFSRLPYIVDAIVSIPLLSWTYCLSMWLAWALFIQAGLAFIGMLRQGHRPGTPDRQVTQVKRNSSCGGHGGLEWPAEAKGLRW
jgi:hypothetical protein